MKSWRERILWCLEKLGRHWVWFLAGGLMAGAVLYFSWIPDPAMGRVGFLPAPISEWADRHDVIRTGVAMVPVGLLTGIFVGVNRGRRCVLIFGVVGVVGLVFIAELGQLLLPQRVFDWRDFGAGSVGGLCGIAAGFGSFRSRGTIRRDL